MTDLSTREYAALIGYNFAALQRVIASLGPSALPVTPYRIGPRGPWRFPAAEVERVHGVQK